MPAKLTLHPVQRASRVIVIRDGESLVVGRDPLCGVIVEDSRVSKRHAELRWSNGAWTLEDLDSKNGTTVNGQPARGAEVRNGDWISFGGLMARFERLSAAQAATQDSERLARIQASGEMRRRLNLNADLEPGDLLRRFLESAMELTRTERGFVLVVAPDGKVRAEVAAGLSPETLRDERFRGSVGAVRQALDTGGPVMLADVRADPGLGKRPSVVAFGIRSLACVPLRHEDKVLGVIYVDSRKLGPAFTDLDLEILERMADHMGAILAPSLADGTRPLRPPPPQASLVAQLQQRIEELLPAS
jgi:pSer/pThr/pTyr-binding forkhead associated (FHA) protein